MRPSIFILAVVALGGGCTGDAGDAAGDEGGAGARAGRGSGAAAGATGTGGGSYAAGQGGTSDGAAGAPLTSAGGGGTGAADGDTASAGASGSGGAGDGTGGAGGYPHAGPTPPAAWVSVTGNLAGMDSECGNMSLVSSKPTSDMLLAGVAQKGLWSSTDGGASWSRLGTGAGSDAIINRPSSIVYDPHDAKVFWESGIYNSNGVYRTRDGGATFAHLGDAHHDDLVSVDFGDPQRRTLLAGGHEQSQTLYRSTDGGETWANVGANLPAGTKFSSYPLVVDPQTHVVGCSGWGDGAAGVYRTSDGGGTWQQVSTAAATGEPLVAAGGAIYWATADGSVLRSTDQGRAWARVGGDVNGAVAPVALPDGRIATVGGGKVVVWREGSADWEPVTDAIPYQPVGLVYSPWRRAFYVWHFDCGNAVLPDAIVRYGFDFEAG